MSVRAVRPRWPTIAPPATAWPGSTARPYSSKAAFLDHSGRSGIFNLGTGSAQSFNDVALATVNACLAHAGKPALALPELVRQRVIEYVPFPPQLVGKYQSYTQADLSALRAAGYREPMMGVAEGVIRYVESLISKGAPSP